MQNMMCVTLFVEDVTEPVAFSARAGDALSYAQDDVIQFPVPITNIGNYYSSDTGIFICPYDGIYLFFSNIRADQSRTYCSVMKDASVMPLMYSISESSAANLVFIECYRGEKVWVRQREDDTVNPPRIPR